MAGDQDLLALTRRTSTLVMTLRHASRSLACIDADALNDLMALELELAALVHEIQMREVEQWLQIPLRGRVTNPQVLSTQVKHGVPVERLDAVTETMATVAVPAQRPAPRLSGSWGRRGRSVSRAS